MNRSFTRFALTDSVKKAQEHYGARYSYARMELELPCPWRIASYRLSTDT